MDKKILLSIVLAIMFLACGTNAAELGPSDAVWQGMINVSLDKNIFSAGESISGSVVVQNMELYPLIGGSLVLHLAEGTYSSSNDNIFLETIIPIDFILPGSSRTIPFSFEPQSSGDYRLDVYSWVVKSKFSGVSSIFLSPSSKQFSVTGVKKTRATINRTETTFNGIVGQEGFSVSPEGKITGNIVINNKSGEEKKSLELGISVCEWASVFCSPSDEKKFSVPSIPANSSTTIKVELVAPKIPSAYEINMKLYNGTSTESVYKNRAIVSGGTAKARKVFIKGLDSKNYSVSVILSGSPDHFNLPEFKDFSVKAEIFDENKLIEEKSSTVALITVGEVQRKDFLLDSKSFSKICIKVVKETIVYENECFDVPLKDAQEAYDEAFPKPVEVSWSYDEATSVLSFSLKNNRINAQVRVFSTEKTFFEEKINTFISYSQIIVVPKENLFLAVDDFDIKQQQLIALNLSLPPEKRDSTELGEVAFDKNAIELFDCYDNACGQGFTCSSSSFNSKQGICCKTPCVPSITLEGELFSIPLIVWIALLVLVVAIIIGINAFKTVRRR